jgi:2-polyprenyl-6-hydroxyphenyl methylase/3-demethylubiquinone-9 3-methyltransferase
MTAANTIDPDEIEKFGRVSAAWWDVEGPFRPLHRLNPVRIDYISGRAATHFGRDLSVAAPFAGLSVLDLGCGGGLVAEPMARFGASVTALDADATAIAAARAHAAAGQLEIDYRVGGPEHLAEADARFELVLALEIVEHVADRAAFLSTVGALVAPGGLLILSTLNRTLSSLVLGVGVAEYLLRWVEPGTHDWRKFVRPSELARDLRQAGFELTDLTGLAFDPRRRAFQLKPNDVRVNYFAAAARPD